MDFHDPVSAYTHLIMAAWSAFVAVILLRLTARHPPGHRLSILVYAVSAVTLYTASGLFHGIRHPSPAWWRAWQLLDQTAIFGLIFGSNVPIAVYLLKPRPRNWLLATMGAVGLVGAASLWLLPWVLGKPPHEVLIAAYLTMGFLGLLPIRAYFRKVGWGGMLWVFLLSFFYVGGAVSEAAKWPVIIEAGWWRFTYHEILHLADMAGTGAHLVLLLKYVLPVADWRPHPAGGGTPTGYVLTPGRSRATH